VAVVAFAFLRLLAEGEQVSSLTKRSVAQVLNSVVIMVVIHWGEEREW